MVNVEGAVRMKRLGQTLLLGGFASLFIGIIALLLRTPPELLIVPIMVLYLGIFPMTIRVTLWAGGWIVEGFLDPRRSQ